MRKANRDTLSTLFKNKMAQQKQEKTPGEKPLKQKKQKKLHHIILYTYIIYDSFAYLFFVLASLTSQSHRTVNILQDQNDVIRLKVSPIM